MRPYVIVTFGLSVLLVAVHALRFVLDGPQVLRDPWFVGATAVAVGVAVWAWRLLRRSGPGAER